MVKVLLVSISILFIGCASKESLKTSSTIEKVCSTKSVDKTYEYLVDKMKIHYLGSTDKSIKTTDGTYYNGNSMVTLNDSIFVENKKVSEDNYEIILSLKNGITHRMYGEMIEVKKGIDNCESTVTLKYMNSMWKKVHGTYVKKWMNEFN